MTKQKRKINQNFLIFVITVLVFITVFFVVQIVRFFEKPINTVLIKKGELINYEEVTGYIIRNEELIDISSYDGIVKSEVEDATRVSKGAPIIKYVSKSEEQLIDKIKKLDEKIEVAKESQQTIFSNDVKALDTEIENSIYTQIKNSTSLDEIKQSKKNLNEKINKKAKIVGELSPAGSELKTLIEERTKYEKELNDAEKSLLSPKAGLVSYRVDGFENILTYDSISLLTTDKLSELKISLDQMIPAETKNVKIIDNFVCYIAVPMKSEEAKNTMLNDTVYLRFSDDEDSLVSATVEYISNEDDETLLVFKINSNVEELTKYRKISLDVVWWRSSGLKVNKEVIFETEVDVLVSGDEEISTEMVTKRIKIPTVTIKKAYSEENVFVKILKETEEFVIIDNYKDSELIEMGVSTELIENRRTIKMYDEAIMIEQTAEKENIKR